MNKIVTNLELNTHNEFRKTNKQGTSVFPKGNKLTTTIEMGLKSMTTLSSKYSDKT